LWRVAQTEKIQAGKTREEELYERNTEKIEAEELDSK